ncbi:MAG: type VI secretion system membrane subunit TssM [Alphaproteobacteria bacterium]
MNAVLTALVARWSLTFVGTALLAVLLWFFGPFLAPLESWAVRLGLIALMFAVWLSANLLLDRRRRRREAVLAEGVAAAAPDPSAAASAEEVEALREKLTAALDLLKRARGTKGYLYEQPWYAIIGPPGAGKTTALLNAGLRFPLAAEMGQNAVPGIGGTRLCEWWFTEEAVLIDTAGRYTTQDSDAAVDRAGWEGFLDLLKRTRLRQPLNGLIVAMPLTEIASAPREERLQHARAIRRRIKEIEERLSIRLPVYALFTKADLLVGFTEFFDDLDREKRSQVWGATFPLTRRDTGPVSDFAAEFQLLIERLNTRLFDRLQAERSPPRRSLIAGFASQVASLEAPLAEFLQEAFGGSRLDPAPMLRGFYFTSGTQEGTPIDRLTAVLARTFGMDQRRAPSLRPDHGRSYFLSRLVKDVIFGEAMLVSERPGAARRRMLARGGAFAAIALVLLLGGALLLQTRAQNQGQFAEMEAALAEYERTASGLPLDPVADADLPRVLPLLDQARALPHGYDRGTVDSWWFPSFGLSQEAKLASGARSVYRHALERVLLPRLIWRLETQMHGNMSRPDFLYEAMRVYLMLGGAGPLDRDLVRSWMAEDWQATYPGVIMSPARDTLSRHLDVLLAQPLPDIPLDGALIEAARATFSRVPLASRVYSRIAPSAAKAVAPWRPADSLGADGAKLFVRASGKPLTDGIPGFYTVNGFYTVLLPALASATKQVARESWVLGASAELTSDSAEALRLERDVIALYQAEYAKHWDAMLADLNLVPLRSPEQAVRELYILASPQSPMRDLLEAIARELTLSQPPSLPTGGAVAEAGKEVAKDLAVTAVERRLPQTTVRLQPLAHAALAATRAEPPGKQIDERYRALRDYVGTGPGAPIEQTFKAMDALRQQLARLAAPGATPAGQGSDDATTLLKAEASGVPAPVNRWLEAMIGSSTMLRTGSTAEQVKKSFNASGGPASLCRQAVSGRYPFNPASGRDIPLDDFTKLFAPGGLIDGFFNTQLRPYVDIGSSVWKGRPLDGVAAPVAPAELVQFQRAAAIRDLFFGAGGGTPALRFDLIPVYLDPGIKQVTLELGGTTATFVPGPPKATQITWPGSGMSTVRLAFDPPPPTGAADFQATGPWALFRLFEQGNLQQAGSPERYQLSFRSGERYVVFELRAGSVQNPFASNALHEFRCPNL